MGTTERTDLKKPTAFRLSTDLVNRLKTLAKKDNRSLNNYVENILISVAYDEPNETTKEAINEAKARKNLENFDFEAFKKYVDSL